jgi:site-specific DNA recombinase
VRRVFRLYAEQGWGPERIARLLNAERLPTSQGLVGRWGANTVIRVLHNPVHAGRVRNGNQEFAGAHQAIVPEALYQAAQALARERAAMAPRARSSPYLLSGLLKCGGCGRNLVTHQTVAKPGRKAFMSYRHRDSATVPKCPPFQRGTEMVDALVVAEVQRLASSRLVREAALAQAREELAARRAPLATEREALLSRLAEGDRAFDRWAERLTKGSIDEDQFERLNRAHLTERRQLRERLEALEAETEQAGDVELTIGEVGQALAQFGTTWEALSLDERRELLRSLVEYLRITPEALTLKLVFLPEVVLPLHVGRGRRRADTS